MELKNRAVEFRDERVETIYFGGGTPSVLNLESVQHILQTIERYYTVETLIEVTFEMNPEDVSLNYLEGLKK